MIGEREFSTAKTDYDKRFRQAFADANDRPVLMQLPRIRGLGRYCSAFLNDRASQLELADPDDAPHTYSPAYMIVARVCDTAFCAHSW
jgi:hypothetical protein